MLLNGMNTYKSINKLPVENDTRGVNQDPNAPVRNAYEQKFYDDITKYRDNWMYTQRLWVSVGGTPKGNFPYKETTNNWPIPGEYIDSSTRYLLLPFMNHGSLGIDISYIGQHSPETNIYPVYMTAEGSVVAVSDNEDTVYAAYSGTGCSANPKKFTVTDNAYGSFIALRNARWVCLNYKEVFLAPDGKYYNDKFAPAPNCVDVSCEEVSGTCAVVESPPCGNPCGVSCITHKKEHWNPRTNEWDTVIDCERKTQCESKPPLSTCIDNHDEFNNPENGLRGHAMIKVPDYEVMIAHLAPGNRDANVLYPDIEEGGSLAKLLLPKAYDWDGIDNFGKLVGFKFKASRGNLFTLPIANMGTDGSKEEREYYTNTPMIHYEVFRNYDTCVGGPVVTNPITMYSADASKLKEPYIGINKTSPPCELPYIPDGYDDACLVWDTQEGFHGIGDPFNNGVNLPTDKNIPDDPSIAKTSFQMPRIPGYEVPQKVVYAGYVAQEITEMHSCDGTAFKKIEPNPIPPSNPGRVDAQFNPVPEVVEVYAQVEKETGVPCEILAGIHFEEGGNSPTKDLQSGAPLGSRTLLESAQQTAAALIATVGRAPKAEPYWTLEETLRAISLYNGGGNRNCQKKDPSCTYPGLSSGRCGVGIGCDTDKSLCNCTEEVGSCRDACNNVFPWDFEYTYCDASGENPSNGWLGFDDPYAVNWWQSPYHDTMYVLYQYDCTQTKPLHPHGRPGVLTVAIAMYLGMAS